MMALLSINMKLGQRILSTKTTQKIIDINDYIVGTAAFLVQGINDCFGA